MIGIFYLLIAAEAPATAESATNAESSKVEAAKTDQNPIEAAPPSDALQYVYNPFGKRDPFRPFILDISSSERASLDPLQGYELSKFVLTGIVSGISTPRAIVIDGAGRGHVIQRGTRIGVNRGQVTRILKDEVIVSEEFRDPLGKLIVTEFAMKLKKNQVAK